MTSQLPRVCLGRKKLRKAEEAKARLLWPCVTLRHLPKPRAGATTPWSPTSVLDESAHTNDNKQGAEGDSATEQQEARRDEAKAEEAIVSPGSRGSMGGDSSLGQLWEMEVTSKKSSVQGRDGLGGVLPRPRSLIPRSVDVTGASSRAAADEYGVAPHNLLHQQREKPPPPGGSFAVSEPTAGWPWWGRRCKLDPGFERYHPPCFKV